MNTYNSGTKVREVFKIGTKVKFKPKSLIGDTFLTGIVESHIYTNVLIIADSSNNKWWVSANRCEVIN